MINIGMTDQLSWDFWQHIATSTWEYPAISILYYTIPYHTIPYHTIPYHTILYYTWDHLIDCYVCRSICICVFHRTYYACNFIYRYVLQYIACSCTCSPNIPVIASFQSLIATCPRFWHQPLENTLHNTFSNYLLKQLPVEATTS